MGEDRRAENNTQKEGWETVIRLDSVAPEITIITHAASAVIRMVSPTLKWHSHFRSPYFDTFLIPNLLKIQH